MLKKMEIKRNNYEIFFIDYFDGKLSEEQISMLMLFLSKNPDLTEEFSNFEEITLPVSEIKFADKNLLKAITQQPLLISDDNFAELNIAYIEGDMNQQEKNYFEKYLLKNPDKYREFSVFAKTKLQPDLNIIFGNKVSLKRFEIIRNYRKAIIIGLSTAAVIMIAFLLYISIPDTSNRNQYAKRTQQKDANILKSEKLKSNDLFVPKLKTPKLNIVNKMVKKPTMYDSKNFVAENKMKNKTKNIEQKNHIENHEIDNLEKTIPIESKKIIALINEEPEHVSPKINFAHYHAKIRMVKKQTIKQYLLAKAQKTFAKDSNKSQAKISFLDVADVILKGVNKIAGKNMKLKKTYDSEGKLETLAFYSSSVQIIKGEK